MSLQTILHKAFKSRPEPSVIKPSFESRQLCYRRDTTVLNIYNVSQKITPMHRKLLKAPTKVTSDIIKGFAQKFKHRPFYVLDLVEGYDVFPGSGMSRDNCSCGSEPIWIGSLENSTEPGANVNLFGKLGKSRNLVDFVNQSNGNFRGLRVHEKKQGATIEYEFIRHLNHMSLSIFQLPPRVKSNNIRHRRFDCSIISNQYKTHVDRLRSIIKEKPTSSSPKHLAFIDNRGVNPGTFLDVTNLPDGRYQIKVSSVYVTSGVKAEQSKAYDLLMGVFA